MRKSELGRRWRSISWSTMTSGKRRCTLRIRPSTSRNLLRCRLRYGPQSPILSKLRENHSNPRKRMVVSAQGSTISVYRARWRRNMVSRQRVHLRRAAHPSQQNALDVMTQGSGDARKQPLWFFLTTAGRIATQSAGSTSKSAGHSRRAKHDHASIPWSMVLPKRRLAG